MSRKRPSTNSTVSPTDLNWKRFTDTFAATGTSTTLVFQNGDPGNDNSNRLDNIALSDLSLPTINQLALDESRNCKSIRHPASVTSWGHRTANFADPTSPRF